MDTAAWILGTALPAGGAVLGMLKWLIRQEIAPHVQAVRDTRDDVRDLKEDVGKLGDKIDRLYERRGR